MSHNVVLVVGSSASSNIIFPTRRGQANALAKLASTIATERGEHQNDRVVAWRTLDVCFVVLALEAEHRFAVDLALQVVHTLFEALKTNFENNYNDHKTHKTVKCTNE